MLTRRRDAQGELLDAIQTTDAVPSAVLLSLVTPGDVAENQVLLDQLCRTLFRGKLRPARLIADAEDATWQNLKRWLQATGWGRRRLPGMAAASPAVVSAALCRGPSFATQTLSLTIARPSEGRGSFLQDAGSFLRQTS